MRISRTLWQGALLALVICAPPASLAQEAVEADVATTEPTETEAAKADAPKDKTPKPTAEDAPARPFIERSLVIAPEQVGKFKLVGMKDYPGDPASGVGVRYQHEDFPTVRLDLFVYPTGRADRDKVLASGMEEVRRALESAEAQGNYSGLEMGDVVEFDLRRVGADGSLLPPSEQARPDRRATDAEVLVAVAKGADYRIGRLLEARFKVRDQALDSRAYLFYRGLYLIKGRISGSPIDLPREAFDRFTHHAMATLVPVLATRSTGGCFQQEITIDPNAGDIAEAIVASAARGAEEQCAKTLDESVPAGHRAVPLVYEPAMWRNDP